MGCIDSVLAKMAMTIYGVTKLSMTLKLHYYMTTL